MPPCPVLLCLLEESHCVMYSIADLSASCLTCKSFKRYSYNKVSIVPWASPPQRPLWMEEMISALFLRRKKKRDSSECYFEPRMIHPLSDSRSWKCFGAAHWPVSDRRDVRHEKHPRNWRQHHGSADREWHRHPRPIFNCVNAAIIMDKCSPFCKHCNCAERLWMAALCWMIEAVQCKSNTCRYLFPLVLASWECAVCQCRYRYWFTYLYMKVGMALNLLEYARVRKQRA